MRIHLVTFASPRFKLRQVILGWSAKFNHVVDTVTHWDPAKLVAAGFGERCSGINLQERGSGYWAWKPFIIQHALERLDDGDIVFYCDVGRRYPFKTLEKPIKPYLEWMRNENQFVMPGVYIPWRGKMSMWTKRSAFLALDLDTEMAHRSSPIQASFSFWITNSKSRALCCEWLELCSNACLINDTPSPAPIEELPDFFEHRHDQSLLSLVCLKNNIHGIFIGDSIPLIDTQYPDGILDLLGHKNVSKTIAGKTLSALSKIIGFIESVIRTSFKFGQNRSEPDYNIFKSSK